MDKVIGVIGGYGNLGQELIKLGCARMECDIQSKDSIAQAIRDVSPSIIINCAAITDVDDCEDALTGLAWKVNGAYVANIRDMYRGNIIHISTSYVFDGKRVGGYIESDDPNPLCIYGKSKLAGEERLLEYNMPGDCIVRTVSLYGGYKADFVTQVINHIRNGREATIPTTLFSNPTYIPHLAEALVQLATMNSRPKIINVAGKDILSRYEWALMALNMFGWGDKLNMLTPIKNSPGNAKRPKNAGLKVRYAERLGLPIYDTVEGLQQMYLQKAYIYSREVNL